MNSKPMKATSIGKDSTSTPARRLRLPEGDAQHREGDEQDVPGEQVGEETHGERERAG